jgi:hypothetical protein
LTAAAPFRQRRAALRGETSFMAMAKTPSLKKIHRSS